MFTVKLTRGEKVVSTKELPNATSCEQAVEAAKKCLSFAQQAGHPGTPNGYRVVAITGRAEGRHRHQHRAVDAGGSRRLGGR
jgi:hypothetical protein